MRLDGSGAAVGFCGAAFIKLSSCLRGAGPVPLTRRRRFALFSLLPAELPARHGLSSSSRSPPWCAVTPCFAAELQVFLFWPGVLYRSLLSFVPSRRRNRSPGAKRFDLGVAAGQRRQARQRPHSNSPLKIFDPIRCLVDDVDVAGRFVDRDGRRFFQRARSTGFFGAGRADRFAEIDMATGGEGRGGAEEERADGDGQQRSNKRCMAPDGGKLRCPRAQKSLRDAKRLHEIPPCFAFDLPLAVFPTLRAPALTDDLSA